MNSVKNVIVTITLLAVSYGAYVVLSNPQPEHEMAQIEDWPDESNDLQADAPPTVVIPDDQFADESNGSFVEDPQAADATALAGTDSGASSTEAPSWDEPLPEAMSPESMSPDGLSSDGTQNVATISPEHGSLPAKNSTEINTESHPSRYVSSQASEYQRTDAPSFPFDPDANASAPANAFEEAWKSIQSNVASGQLSDALFALSVWYEEPTLTAEQSARCVRLLDELAGQVIYSQDNYLEPAYVVQEGETLQQIAQQYSVPLEFLARINGIQAPYELFPGETLKVVRGPFRAELNYHRSEITLFLGRYYAGRFKARIGGGMPENVSHFEVAVKEHGREFFDRRTGYRVSRDDPSNPYGDRWIGLRGDQITAAHNVGIHVDAGNLDQGCIAVNQTDADDLMAILSVGSRLTIKR